MRIRKVDIHNYRGIKSLTWDIPADRRLITLIGPGDSGKSTILEAILLALGDKWNPAISDTDFFDSDIEMPIVIRLVVSDLPDSLVRDNAFGLCLTGINETGELSQDPDEGFEPCIIVQLIVDATLEPMWTVERLDGEDASPLRANHRRLFATFKVDERADTHLRWTRTSALGRMSSNSGGAQHAMALASRAARDAISELEDADLVELTATVQTRINAVGGGSFSELRAGLDTSLSSAGGNLALYESNVPLTNYGLGTKRLAALAVQQLASLEKSTLLIDEIEHGLEPHRLVELLQYLRSDDSYDQIFITTHSPVAVEQSTTDALAVVRRLQDHTTVGFLPSAGGTSLRLRRSRPSSFLAQRIAVVEGKTEEGFLKYAVKIWDKERLLTGLPISAGIGSVIQDGQGGSEVPLRAIALAELGYEVHALMDNDDRTVDKAVTKAKLKGIEVTRWGFSHNIEQEIVTSLNADGLTELLQLGVELRGDERTVLNDLRAKGLPIGLDRLSVVEWISSGALEIDEAVEYIAAAAVESSWFKNVDGGIKLGAWSFKNRNNFTDQGFWSRIKTMKTFIYATKAV